MMAMLVNRERTKSQWTALLDSVELRIEGIWSKDVISESMIEAVLAWSQSFLFLLLCHFVVAVALCTPRTFSFHHKAALVASHLPLMYTCLPSSFPTYISLPQRLILSTLFLFAWHYIIIRAPTL